MLRQTVSDFLKQEIEFIFETFLRYCKRNERMIFNKRPIKDLFVNCCLLGHLVDLQYEVLCSNPARKHNIEFRKNISCLQYILTYIKIWLRDLILSLQAKGSGFETQTKHFMCLFSIWISQVEPCKKKPRASEGTLSCRSWLLFWHWLPYKIRQQKLLCCVCACQDKVCMKENVWENI